MADTYFFSDVEPNPVEAGGVLACQLEPQVFGGKVVMCMGGQLRGAGTVVHITEITNHDPTKNDLFTALIPESVGEGDYSFFLAFQVFESGGKASAAEVASRTPVTVKGHAESNIPKIRYTVPNTFTLEQFDVGASITLYGEMLQELEGLITFARGGARYNVKFSQVSVTQMGSRANYRVISMSQGLTPGNYFLKGSTIHGSQVISSSAIRIIS